MTDLIVQAQRMPSESFLQMCSERIAVESSDLLLIFEQMLLGLVGNSGSLTQLFPHSRLDPAIKS